MNYANKISSLEEKASAQVAINLCQETGFKEVALCFEKPTYGCFIDFAFVSDPDIFPLWDKADGDYRFSGSVMDTCYMNERDNVRRWEEAVDVQCRRLTDGIPRCLRQGIHPWMNHIALEYLSYCRRQEALFGVSRYFLMKFFTVGDWDGDARLDEEKLARRLLAEDQLAVLQRYRIACVYCLHEHIPQLWERLTQEEKRFATGDGSHETTEDHGLVLLWSLHMNGNRKLMTSENYLFFHAVSEASDFGNRWAVKLCWGRLDKPVQQQIAVTLALESLRKWQTMGVEHVKKKSVSNESSRYQSSDAADTFNLPSHYSELMCFFLSQMDERQQMTFFEKSFQTEYCNQSLFSKSVLECFLDFPYQDDFLPTVNRLWGIIPKCKYGQCLLALAGKYSRNDEKGIRDFDYGSLIYKLWDDTPVEYKQYLFSEKEIYFSPVNEGNELLSVLLKRSPFLGKDEALFKHIFRCQPQEERRAMLLSEVGRNMCSLLVQKGKFSFADRLLEECLSKEEVPGFKKRFVQSDCGVKLCVDLLSEDRVKLLEDLLGWSLESDVEKARHKGTLISCGDCLDACEPLLRKNEFAKVENMISFCSSSDVEKERSRAHLAQYACIGLLGDYASQCWSREYKRDPSLEDPVWEEMNTIIAWIQGTEGQVRDLKNNIISSIGYDVHYHILFTKSLWGEIETFYKWFGLSSGDIKGIKRDTLFDFRVIQDIFQGLPKCADTLVASLLWCITDEEMVMDLKEKIVEKYFTGFPNAKEVMEEKRLDRLISELLDGFREKEVRDRTGRDSVSLNDKGEKRSVIGGESTPPKKAKQVNLRKKI